MVFVKVLFGFCLYILENILLKFGVEVIFVDGIDLDVWCVVVWFDIKVCFFEFMFNLMFEVIDIKVVVDIVYFVGVIVVVDNVFFMLVYFKVIE